MNKFWPYELTASTFKNLISFILLSALSLNINAKIELLDRVIAVVDSGVIMETQLNARVEEVLKRLQSTKAELPPLNLLEEQVLNRLIIEEIQKVFAGNNEDLLEIAQIGLRESSYFGVPILTRLITLQGSQQGLLTEISNVIGDELITLLEAEDPETRRRSSIAIGILNEMRFEEPLLVCLEDASNQVKFSAAASLASMGSKKGIDFLFEAMRNKDPILRSNAVKFLAEVQESGETVQEQLIDSMQDADPLSRAGAAQEGGDADGAARGGEGHHLQQPRLLLSPPGKAPRRAHVPATRLGH